MHNSRLRVLIVDDSAFFRHRIEEVLNRAPDIEIVGKAYSAIEGIEVINKEKPDLVFLDIQMPGMDGFDVLRALEAEGLRLEHIHDY